MLDLQGLQLTEAEKALIQRPAVGGLIFFARNFESRKQIIELVKEIRALRPEILLAVDQEGGRVQRFKQDFTRIPPMQMLGDLYKKDTDQALLLAKNSGWLMASEILACGIDISFAPVLDVDDHACAVIADRAFSPDPETVTALGACFVEGMREAGMASTGKHFPGHGSVAGDSHLVLPVDDRPFEQVMSHDGTCFASLIGKGLDAVMPAHIVFSQVDAQPVGFSALWLQTILRQQLGFEGVIFSDDLSMEGATGAGSYAERAALALSAGCDMVLACNNRAGALEVLDWLEREGCESSTRLSSMAARRSLDWVTLEGDSRYRETRRQLKLLGD